MDRERKKGFDGIACFQFLNRFAYGNATTREFQKAMEDASGQSLGWFFDEWIFAAGMPTYQWAWVSNPAPSDR